MTIPTRLFIGKPSASTVWPVLRAGLCQGGQFSFVTGIVTVESRGRNASSGGRYGHQPNDVITTGPNGMAQLVMKRSSAIVLALQFAHGGAGVSGNGHASTGQWWN